MARNIDRKQLKNPDQFVSFWTRIATAVATHRRRVIGLLLTAVAVIVGVWGALAYKVKRDAAASAAFARIERVALAQLLPDKEDASTNPNDGLPHFKTEKERILAALKEIDVFLGSYGGSKLRDEALLLKGRYHLAAEKPAEAEATYRELLGGVVDTRLRFLAQEGLGYALEAGATPDQAIAAFGAAADEAQKAGGFYRDRALFQKARLLEKKGSAQEADKLYREILEKAPTTALRDEINDRLAAHEKK